MRKLSTVIAATLLFAGVAFTAQAQTWRGSADLNGAAQNFTPITKAACGGRWGPRCPPGPALGLRPAPLALLVRALLSAAQENANSG